MPEPETPLVLHIYGPAEPIEGDARSGDGPPRRFSSWMEMVALIEHWRSEPGRSDGSNEDSEVER